jgi:hypothetical protein
MSHVTPISPVTSAGGDATDTVNNALRVNVVAGGASGGTSSTFGAGFPGTGTAVGVKDQSGNMTWLTVDVSGNLLVSGTGGGGGGAATIADGADVAQGSTTDAAVTTDINATLSGKLRGLVKILGDVWDSANHFLRTKLVDASGAAFGTVTNPLTAVPNVLSSTSGTFNGVGVSIGLAVPIGGRWLALRSTPNTSNNLIASVVLEFSVDGGATYNSGYSPQTRQYTVFSSGGTRGTFATPLFDGSNMQIEVLAGPLDRNVTHARFSTTSYTSGTFAATVDCFADEPDFTRYAIASSQNSPSGSQYGNATAGTLIVGGSDGSGVTFPLNVTNAGSVSQFDPLLKVALGNVASAASIRIKDSGGNQIDGATSAPAGTERGLITRNIPSGTQAVSGTVTTSPPANASTNVTQWNGTTVDTNNGLKSAGTLRMVLATDQPQLTNALKVDGSAVTQPVSGTVTTTPPSNASTNVTQFGSNNVATGVGASGVGIPRVTVSNDSAVKVWDGTNVSAVDASGGLKVHIIANDVSSSGGTSSADGASYVAGTTAGTPLMGARDDAATTSLAEDKVGIARLTSLRALHVNLRDNSGNELGVAAAPVQVSLANTGANATAVTTSDSHLPAAVALSDALANPTTTEIGANLLGWDGSVWRRARYDSINQGLQVVTPSGYALSVTASELAGAAFGVLTTTGDIVDMTLNGQQHSPNAWAIQIGFSWSMTSSFAVIQVEQLIINSETSVGSGVEAGYYPIPVTCPHLGRSFFGPITITPKQNNLQLIATMADLSANVRVRLLDIDHSGGSVVGVTSAGVPNGAITITNPLPPGSNLIGKVDASGTPLAVYPVGRTTDWQQGILQELKVITHYLKSGLGVFDEPCEVRQALEQEIERTIN